MNTVTSYKRIEILDTTLRDGAQGEGISFSVQDKLAIVRALDELGVRWIEAGNPGSNPKDMEFFQRAAKLKLEHAELAAFGSTRKKGVPVAEDRQVQSLLSANTGAVVIFGKSWDIHVTEILRVTLEENLAMIGETIAFLKQNGRAVIFDAEHFFDGYAANPGYALSTVKTALASGADRIVLCDTNGGGFPDAIARVVEEILYALGGGSREAEHEKGSSPPPVEAPGAVLGVHLHNDAGMATASTLMAIKAGCSHIQGTLLGFGERCGNAALAEIIPSIELKLMYRCIADGKLEHLFSIARAVAEISNVAVPDSMPYIGASAFSHKAGMHADGILKVSRSFEHVEPYTVGNSRRFLMSEVGGRSAIAERVRKIDPLVTKDHPAIAALAAKLKALEAEGWQFEGADGSFEIMARQELGKYQPLFAIAAYRVVSEHPARDVAAYCHAWAKVLVDGQQEIAAAEGDGPVNALDGALRGALTRFYPQLSQVRLTDYKVRVIDGKDATAAKVRVLIESTDGVRTWTTVGVSTDIIDASHIALTDAIEYKIIMDIERRFKAYL
ncbi:MAG: citramalate synthase [Treponema sp.]|jgi:2-isopropylmalate synthase|nr:citramalate synthase [Treponema sp.]